MAGLCEGGNGPPGSLKASHNVVPYTVDLMLASLREGTIKSAVSHNIEYIVTCNSKYFVEQAISVKRRHRERCSELHYSETRSRLQLATQRLPPEPGVTKQSAFTLRYGIHMQIGLSRKLDPTLAMLVRVFNDSKYYSVFTVLTRVPRSAALVVWYEVRGSSGRG
ncbi:hypothetical protein ANN_16344 [Periplaneta americana]|uniref:Uncharacterized protein n=1 Tax=Periplaneta americana TaxID=6978 RepID=A0ABQ8SKN0_PERAM|nr:hypothetical protein ANN_16344 [Periplaneta americana]